MRTWKRLFPRICSFDNLLLASKNAQRGKRFRPDVFEFNARLEENLLALQRELEEQAWMPGVYREFYVQESKRRLISAAPYRDRVVHHALCSVVEPLFDPTFIYDSYACRKGKGTHAAADRYTSFSRRAKYVLKCDVSRYFPSVRHDALFGQLARRIGCRKTLWLCEEVIRSRGDRGELWLSGQGIPIGNLTSQFFANVYLNEFDHWMKEKVGARLYIRYVDDFVVLSNSKAWLQSLIPEIEERLGILGLRLHERKRAVFPVSEGCDFMGYRIWPEHRRLRPQNGYRYQRKLKTMAGDYRQGLIDSEEVKASIMSWVGHASHADTWGLRSAIFAKVSFSRGQVVARASRRFMEQ